MMAESTATSSIDPNQQQLVDHEGDGNDGDPIHGPDRLFPHFSRAGVQFD